MKIILFCNFFLSKDYIVDSYEFLKTPFPLVTLLTVYLWIVLKVAPAYMKSRKPFNISAVIQFYNVFQVVACAYFVAKFHELGFSFRNTWKCVDDLKVGREEETFVQMWWFLMLRTLELIETIFFILRKKQNQVSALHLYHHISTIVLLWLYFKYSAGELINPIR